MQLFANWSLPLLLEGVFFVSSFGGWLEWIVQLYSQ